MSQNPHGTEAVTGLLKVRPPSVERFTMVALPVTELSIARPATSHTLCFGSKATEGSLMRAHGPAGVAKTVVPGRNPFVQVAPLFVEVAYPMFEAPPLLNRPVWKTDMIVEPDA